MSPALAGLVCLLASAPSVSARGEVSVRAVLFVSPTCPHCRMVKEQALPAFAERFGPRLQLALVSTATPSGMGMFLAACRHFGVQRPVVPMLVVGDRMLLGSEDIPERFPGIVDGLLASGGSSWPDIPGLEPLVADAQPDAAPEPEPVRPSAPPAWSRAARSTLAPAPRSSPERAVSPAPKGASAARRAPDVATFPAAVAADRSPGLVERLALDPYGNSLAVLVLLGMIAVVTRAAILVRRAWPIRCEPPEGWATPALSLAGLGVAAYLTWVEVGRGEAVCGPVGDCNTVQQSEYAALFGLVPIGVLGIAGFGAVLIVWLLGRAASRATGEKLGTALLALTGFGTVFSIYLTFLEPFVIGATCLWCLSSAAIMTLLLRLSLPLGPAAAAAHNKAAARGRHGNGTGASAASRVEEGLERRSPWD